MNGNHAEFLSMVGRRFWKLRQSRGETMSIAHDIRERYGVKLDPSYLSKIERGKTEMPFRTLIALCAYFGIKPGAVLDEDFTAISAPGERV